ncbi:NHLP leader peptide family RiPP precursor [Pontibacter sp. G13]|uniref:NHLP leader peptide family RiPP precursor n=1 Tax=Pontibacter sp. G13 TaxID=3074898 RepID=UPI00288A0C67|nr:NHLP leader peptide family RiPP precursor [Pontibacter sp. G13]WNJ16381.1 NHLP leader peptide family RiPP precursor [Pontibacter sp. G13]
MEKKALYQEIVKRAWEDESFKAELVQSPVAAIEKAFGQTVSLPAGSELRVVDQTDPSYSYLNLPAQPNYDEMELSDEQLELVAGGEFVLTAITIVGTSTIISGIISYTVASPSEEKK